MTGPEPWRGEEHPDDGGELPFLPNENDWPNPEGPEWRIWKDKADEEDDESCA